MRIAIMGGQGTGKTTLCQALADQFALTVIPEDLTELVNLASKVNESTNDRQKREEWLNKYVKAALEWLKRREEIHHTKERFVADSCCFDILYRLIRLLMISGENDKLLECVIRICERQSGQLDLIAVLPLNQWPHTPTRNEAGLTRNMRLSHRIYHQALIYGVLNQFSRARVLTISANEGNVGARIDKITRTLQRLGVPLPPPL